MAKEFDKEVAEGKRSPNPLHRFEKMNDDQLAKELTNPANAPLFVAAHMAIDLHTLNRHKDELHVTLEALGFFFNADMVYAKSDEKHEHLLKRKEAEKEHIPYDPGLPTDTVLQRSEHAANIRKWLKKGALALCKLRICNLLEYHVLVGKKLHCIGAWRFSSPLLSLLDC